jgi:uncharacterized protein
MMQSSKHQSNPLKIVVDTNLYLSLFVFRSSMLHYIFELVIDEKLLLFTSPPQLQEIKKKFTEFAVPHDVEEMSLFFISSKATMLRPTITIQESRDATDNFLLELSEFAHADYLITRDNDLLVLKKRKETEIILPEDFLPLLRKMNVIE